ncbi:MAG: dephospho-CoA kinase [Clostridium sp.]
MLKIGLTGGIGSGKSTISKMLVQAGFPVIDADSIAKMTLEKYPEILERVRIEFGEGFFDWRGEFRRKEFGNHIFRFPKQRKKYEDLIMPYIKREIFESLHDYEQKNTPLVVLDAPTLIEQGLNEEMDYIILVWIDSNTQVQRIKERDKLSRDEIVNRINAQYSLEKKKEMSDILIDNNGKIENTLSQVGNIINFLRDIS